jgi:hypothetical protein
MDVDDPPNLQRFVDAQKGVFEAACTELREGQKRTHWMCRFRRSMQHPAGHLIWQYVSSGPSFGVAVRFYLNRTPFLCFWFADAS